MAYLYRKNRSPFWYVQYLDSNRKKRDKSTGLRADDSNETLKARIMRAELEAKARPAKKETRAERRRDCSNPDSAPRRAGMDANLL